MTFSICARHDDAWGVAVATRVPRVGAIVPRVIAGQCALATQSHARMAYLDELSAAIAEGTSAAEAIRRATAADPDHGLRQLGAVSPTDAATFTGDACMAWAGGVAHADGETAYAIQGNILTGPDVVAAMERAFLDTAAEPLERRLLAALLAGDAAGGDSRGRQSAALVVHSPGLGYDGYGVVADLRVDDHEDPVSELARLLDLPDEPPPLPEQHTLTGLLVTLEPLDRSYAATMHDLLHDEEVGLLTGSVHSRAALHEPLPWSVRDLAVVLDRWRRDPTRHAWAIRELATGDVVGEIVLMDKHEGNRSCGLRLWIAGATGRGLGREAISLALHHAFGTWGCERVELEVYDHNPRARHVYEALGFVHEGTRRRALRLDDTWIDAHVMAVLTDDWSGPSLGSAS
ncbi:MAG: GNAT family N-acetyltransferase [Tetrasphaera sp.]|nr:GNAT family N-acetyltransferase [Tetrasphaera sp.]